METLKSNSNTKIFKNTIFLYVRMLVTLLVNLYSTRVLLNALGVEDFGIFNVVGGFVTMLGFFNSSMSQATQRFYNFELGQKGIHGIPNIFTSAFITQVLLAASLLLILETFGLWYLTYKLVIPAERNLAALWIFQFSVISMIVSIIQVPYAAFILAKEHMDYYAYVGLFDVFIKLGVIIGLQYYVHDKLIFYGFALLIISFANFLCYYLFVKCKYKIVRFEKHIDKSVIRAISSFTGWNMYETGAYMLNNQGINLILNAFFGPVVNAARGIGFQINNALRQFCLNVVVAFKPQITQSYASGDYKRTKSLFYFLTIISYVFMYTLSVPVIIEIDYILSLWIGDEALPKHTAMFSVLIIINYLINIFNTPMSQVIHATGHIKKYQIVAGTIILLNLPVSIIALQLGAQAESVFIISIILSIINQFPCIYLLRQEFSFSIREYCNKCIIKLIPITIALPVLPLIIKQIVPPSFIRLILISLCVLIISVITSYCFILDNNLRKTLRIYISSNIHLTK